MATAEASHHGNEPFRSFCSLGPSLPRVEQLTGAPLHRPVDARPFHRAAAPRLKPRCARRDARINPVLAALEIELWTTIRAKSGKPPPPLLATDDAAPPLPRALVLHRQIRIRRSGLERRVFRSRPPDLDPTAVFAKESLKFLEINPQSSAVQK